MSGTIAYDLPMRDLIAGLNATGHVTHTAYRKTHVTLHHNAGRLTHDGVLSVWRYRPASAHFNIDAAGTACQFVRVNEYAWATGNTAGNMRSISIEMCNATLGPDWLVSEKTWRAAARLAGWLFARVIGTRPTSSTLVFHKEWYPTSCAGPYMDKVYKQVLAAAQAAYDDIVRGATPTKPPVVSKPVVTPPKFPLPKGAAFGPHGADGLYSGRFSHRDDLKRWQLQMIKRGWKFPKFGADGLYGDEVAAVAEAFQREKGLKPDRLIGLNTWNYAWTAPIT